VLALVVRAMARDRLAKDSLHACATRTASTAAAFATMPNCIRPSSDIVVMLSPVGSASIETGYAAASLDRPR